MRTAVDFDHRILHRLTFARSSLFSPPHPTWQAMVAMAAECDRKEGALWWRGLGWVGENRASWWCAWHGWTGGCSIRETGLGYQIVLAVLSILKDSSARDGACFQANDCVSLKGVDFFKLIVRWVSSLPCQLFSFWSISFNGAQDPHSCGYLSIATSEYTKPSPSTKSWKR